MKKVVMVWGMFKGQTGVITKQQGKNLIVKLETGFYAGYEIDASVDHVNEVSAPETAIQAAAIEVGDMFKPYSFEKCSGAAKEVLKVERRGTQSVKVTVKADKKTWSYMFRLGTTVYTYGKAVNA